MHTNWTDRIVLGASMAVMACGNAPPGEDGSGGGSSAASLSATDASDNPTTTGVTNNDSLGTGAGSMGVVDSGSGSATMDGSGSATMDGSGSATMGSSGATEGATMGATEGSESTDATDSSSMELGCGGIDFLFVIDNSGSMAEQQNQLLESFPAFITAIQESLGDTVDSYHVGVVTTDAYAGNQPGCSALGDLVTQTEGEGSLGEVCTPFAEGQRFATEMDDLTTVFPCMAQVGTDGESLEQPVAATIAALDPARNGPGGCNEGFLRDDALLVVVVLTDDPPWEPDLDDAHPEADTSEWYDAVLAAKGDDPEAVVMLGFVPWSNVSCVFFELESPNLIDFVMSFGDQGVLASVCEPDYGPSFIEAVSTIETTCEGFEPPA